MQWDERIEELVQRQSRTRARRKRGWLPWHYSPLAACQRRSIFSWQPLS